MELRITDIEWDTDGQEVDLPKEVVLDAAEEGIEDPEAEVADWLSDRYGWLVKGFSIGSGPAPA